MSSRSRFWLVALLATVVLVPLTAGGIALAAHLAKPRILLTAGCRTASGRACPRRRSSGCRRPADKRSIIIFKNQLGRLPATRSDTRARIARGDRGPGRVSARS